MAGGVDELALGRRAYAQRAWSEARERLARADRSSPLSAADLELLATAAYMLGRDAECDGCRERAFQSHLEAGETLRAVRSAWFLGIDLMVRGELGRASGWLGRAWRLVERAGDDCVERGYLLLGRMLEHQMGGELDAALACAAEAVAIGERFGDADLFALASQDQGALLVKTGRVAEGLKLLDEAMVAVTAGEVSPIVSGYVYCGVITGCQDAYELRRAQEWTAALTRWCEQQPDMVSFTGTCLVHRAEILQLRGAWTDALEEARRARDRCERANNRATAALALYREGELHRVRGDFAAAERAYRAASLHGCEPQPGLALLRVAQGNATAAAAAIRRALDEASAAPRRAALLPAFVEIMLAVGDHQAARSACWELQEIAAPYGGGMLAATVAQARGAVELADGDALAALAALRFAAQEWQALDVPYEAARTRELLALACGAVGDDDAAALELEAARSGFEQLRAAADLARVDALVGGGRPGEPHGLTARELQVLRLVAAGKSNREIAATLVISEHTVARHLQNIFAKLDVSSRTAASAFAYGHDLV